MAKKKNENTLQYLQMPLPEGRKYSKMTKVAFGGLNKRNAIDSGEMSVEKNISTSEYPCITPCKRIHYAFDTIANPYPNPISMCGFDDFLIVVYRENTAVKIDYITADGTRYKGTLKTLTKAENETDTEFNARCEAEDNIPRSIVQFNVYTEGDTGTIIDGTFKKRLLIFPDKKSMFFDLDDLLNDTNTKPTGDNFVLYDMDANGVVTPPIKYATVHLSRVFGVDDNCVYASKFNDYTNWALDTAGDDVDSGYDESNAWMSQTQSNTKADGKFTGIINYQGHIVCFKRDYMHEIYNTKNPFRIVDVYAEGAIDNRTIQDVDGKLIFVSDDNVKIYTGSNPRIIGNNLNIKNCEYAVSGTDNRNYYLYCYCDNCESLYVYDTYTGLWSEHSTTNPIISFAHNKNGMYMLDSKGVIRKYYDDYDHSWLFETDLITNQTVDIKHIKKIQMLVEMQFGSKIEVYAFYDGQEYNPFYDVPIYSFECNKSGYLNKFPIRVKLRKTANYGFKLRVEGKGYVKIHGLEIFVEQGGDLYV